MVRGLCCRDLVGGGRGLDWCGRLCRTCVRRVRWGSVVRCSVAVSRWVAVGSWFVQSRTELTRTDWFRRRWRSAATSLVVGAAHEAVEIASGGGVMSRSCCRLAAGEHGGCANSRRMTTRGSLCVSVRERGAG